MIFNPNQRFGNRIANIAFAQGSQNLQQHIIIIMAASSQSGNIDQEFFPYSIYYVNCWFWSFFGSSKGEPQEDIQKQLCQSWFSTQTRVLATGLLT